MRNKRLILALAAFVCALAVTMGITSCSSDDDGDGSNIIQYVAAGNITVPAGDEAAGANALPAYNEAMRGAMGGNFCTIEIDAAIISACDAVYAQQRAEHPMWVGSVKVVRRNGTGYDRTETVIKTYTYTNEAEMKPES